MRAKAKSCGVLAKGLVQVCGVAGLWLALCGLSSYAQLLVYEGFNYDPSPSFPSPNDGTLGGGADGSFGFADFSVDPSWAAAQDPEGPGWVTQQYVWKVGNNGPGSTVSNEDQEVLGLSLSYTDSKGNTLAASGGSLDVRNWNTNVAKPIRIMDTAAIKASHPDLIFDTPGDPTDGEFGKYGSTIWLSFLGNGRPEDGSSGGGQGSMFGLGSDYSSYSSWDTGPHTGAGQKMLEIGRPYGLQADGTPGNQSDLPNDSWGIMRNRDGTTYGNDLFFSPGSPGDPTSATDGETVFFVMKLDFLGPFDRAAMGQPTGDFGTNISAWINPDLDAEPLGSDPSNFADEENVWEIAFSILRIAGNADATYDEFRIGRTYADVAPIAAGGLDGDFDGDGDVDGADFLEWQRSSGGAAELALWEGNFGTASQLAAATVPEPSSVALVFAATLFGWFGRSRRR